MGKNKERDGGEKMRGKPPKENGNSRVSRLKKLFGGKKKAEEPEEHFSITGALRRVSHLFALPIFQDEGPEESATPRRGDERSTPHRKQLEVPADDSDDWHISPEPDRYLTKSQKRRLHSRVHLPPMLEEDPFPEQEEMFVENNTRRRHSQREREEAHLTPSQNRRLHSRVPALLEEYPSPLKEQEEIFVECNTRRAYPESKNESSRKQPATRSVYATWREDFPEIYMPRKRLARYGMSQKARPPENILPTRSVARSPSPVAAIPDSVTESEESLEMPGDLLARLPQRARTPKRYLPTRSRSPRSVTRSPLPSPSRTSQRRTLRLQPRPQPRRNRNTTATGCRRRIAFGQRRLAEQFLKRRNARSRSR